MEFIKKRELLSKYIDGITNSKEEAQVKEFICNEDPVFHVLLENFWYSECQIEFDSDFLKEREQIILQKISDLEHYTSQGYCLGILQ